MHIKKFWTWGPSGSLMDYWGTCFLIVARHQLCLLIADLTRIHLTFAGVQHQTACFGCLQVCWLFDCTFQRWIQCQKVHPAAQFISLLVYTYLLVSEQTGVKASHMNVEDSNHKVRYGTTEFLGTATLA